MKNNFKIIGGRNIASDLGRSLARERCKQAAEVVQRKRKAKLHPSFTDKLYFGEKDLAPPEKKDFDNWANISRYMEASQPHLLQDLKIFSGRVNPSVLVSQVNRFRDEDSFTEKLFDKRNRVADFYAALTPNEIERYRPTFHPYVKSVVQNIRSPGALIHEIGHAIDMNKREGESNFMKHLRVSLKPNLWQEHSAWRKGRKAYQEGYAAGIGAGGERVFDHLPDYLDNMESYNRAKYPAFGSYLGGSLGGMTGVIGGIAASAALGGGPRSTLGLAALGSALGGPVGILSGGLAGRLWASLRAKANKNRAVDQLSALIEKDTGRLMEVSEQLKQLHDSSKSKPSSDRKQDSPKKKKAA